MGDKPPVIYIQKYHEGIGNRVSAKLQAFYVVLTIMITVCWSVLLALVLQRTNMLSVLYIRSSPKGNYNIRGTARPNSLVMLFQRWSTLNAEKNHIL